MMKIILFPCLFIITVAGCAKSSDHSTVPSFTTLSALVTYSISDKYPEPQHNLISDTISIFHQDQQPGDTIPVSLTGFKTNKINFSASGYTLTDRIHISGFKFYIPCDAEIILNKPYKIESETSVVFWNGFKTPSGFVTFNITLTFTRIITDNNVMYGSGVFAGDVSDDYSPKTWSLQNGSFINVRLK
jgi:hypothetical protein